MPVRLPHADQFRTFEKCSALADRAEEHASDEGESRAGDDAQRCYATR